MVISDEPVPYVALTWPGENAACPNSAACESPIALAIGMPLSAGIAVTSPKLPFDGLTAGRMAGGMENNASSSGSQDAVRRFNSCVREAFVASQAWTAPPVKFQ